MQLATLPAATPLDLLPWYAAPGPLLRAGMVLSSDGASGVQGSSRPLSTTADRAVLRTLRACADVVLVGAGTARDEDYGPVPLAPPLVERRLAEGRSRTPRLAVVTGSGRLDPDSRLFAGEPPLVLTSEPVRDRLRALLGSRAEVVGVGRSVVDLAAALDALRAQGLGHVLCEGGPALLGDLLRADLVDELCWTVSPVLTDRAPAAPSEESSTRRGRCAGGTPSRSTARCSCGRTSSAAEPDRAVVLGRASPRGGPWQARGVPGRDDLRSGLRGVLSGTRALDDWALARLQRRGRRAAPAAPSAPARSRSARQRPALHAPARSSAVTRSSAPAAARSGPARAAARPAPRPARPAAPLTPPTQRAPRGRAVADRPAEPLLDGRPTVMLLDTPVLDELDLELAAEFPDFPEVAVRPAARRRWPRGPRDLVLPAVLLSEFLAGVVIGIIT